MSVTLISADQDRTTPLRLRPLPVSFCQGGVVSRQFTLWCLVIVRHLESRATETALDVEAFVSLAAVEDALVAADLGCDVVEGLDDAQSELLALLVLCDGDVFDVADDAQVVDAAIDQLRLLASVPSRLRPGQKGAELRLGGSAYNLRSTINEPHPTTLLLSSSTTKM